MVGLLVQLAAKRDIGGDQAKWVQALEVEKSLKSDP